MAATITYTPSIAGSSFVTAKVVSDNTAYKLNVGFEPSWAIFVNITDMDTFCIWTKTMTADHAMSVAAAAADVSSGGVTLVAQTDGTNFGLSVGTNALINESGDTYDVIIAR